MKAFFSKADIEQLMTQVTSRKTEFGVMYKGLMDYQARLVPGAKLGTWEVYFFLPGDSKSCERHIYTGAKRDALWEALDWCVNGLR